MKAGPACARSFATLTFVAALCVALPAGSAPVTPSKVAADALVSLQAHMDVANRAMGEDGALALGQRLADDLENLDGPVPPPGFSQADFDERLARVAELDASIVKQVLSGKREPLGGARGLVERLMSSRTDGTLQPVALYVPTPLGPHPSLVVLLHGRPQTETEILGEPYFRRLADASDSIIVAPWGRNNYDFFGAAADDVYQAADEVAAAYGVDAKRVFLAGYSMGGFSVFRVGPKNGSRWAAVMSISGAIVNSETASVSKAFRNTPIYVVNGKLDQSIPPQYGLFTAQYLASVGIPTGFYQEPKGTHMIPTLMPALSAAWGDMLKGVVRNPPSAIASESLSLPQMLPDAPSLKP